MQKKITILFIEDEKNILTFVSTILKKHNYKVLTASTGAEGIQPSIQTVPI